MKFGWHQLAACAADNPNHPSQWSYQKSEDRFRVQSLTGCADLEDLGICAPGCQHSAACAADIAFPAFLRDRPTV